MSNFKKLFYILIFILIIEIILIFLSHHKQQKIENNIIYKATNISLSNDTNSSFYKKLGVELIK